MVLENIYFDFDSDKLDDKSRTEISKIETFMNKNPDIRIEISGHTDNTGSRSYNLDLSKRRANSLFIELTKKGISPSRIEFIGYADQQPLVENTTESGRALNRRIELRIL